MLRFFPVTYNELYDTARKKKIRLRVHLMPLDEAGKTFRVARISFSIGDGEASAYVPNGDNLADALDIAAAALSLESGW